jgi:hypothetical protein
LGSKPDGIINFLTERASAQTNATLKIPQGLPCGGSLHGFQKKTEKTPSKELDIALNRMNDYIARSKK